MPLLRTSSGFEVDVDPATAADEDDLHAAYAVIAAEGTGYPHSRSEPIDRSEFRDYWLDHKSAVVVARRDGRLAGSYYLKPNFPGRGAHIANAGYFVLPGFRGRGLGEALVTHSMDEARRLAFDALQFNLVFESNPARRLYERLGFEPVGRIPDAIDGQAAIVYWRKI